MSKRQLFRPQAVAFAGGSILGRVGIVQPVTLRCLSILMVVLCAGIGTFLWLGEYARKETVHGYLEPAGGMVDIYPDSGGGVVQHILVSKGQYVSKQTPLVQLAFPRTQPGGEDTHARVLLHLQAQRQQLHDQLAANTRFHVQERTRLQQRLADTNMDIGTQHRFLRLQQRRITLDGEMLSALQKLRANGGISKSRWLQAMAEQLEQHKEQIVAEQRLTSLQASRRAVRHELQRIPYQEEKQALQLTLQLSSINKQITELNGRRARVINAPVSGRVSAVQAGTGMAVEPQTPLLSIIPAGTELESVLLVPSKAAGFIEPGLQVRLMFDAFPHQQFGTFPAVLRSVADSPITGTELRAPIRPNTPVFVARAVLQEGAVNAMGQQRQLQAGLLLKADIILERRSLLDWLLEPLYSLRGRT